jgi:hypothetical protein
MNPHDALQFKGRRMAREGEGQRRTRGEIDSSRDTRQLHPFSVI